MKYKIKCRIEKSTQSKGIHINLIPNITILIGVQGIEPGTENNYNSGSIVTYNPKLYICWLGLQFDFTIYKK